MELFENDDYMKELLDELGTVEELFAALEEMNPEVIDVDEHGDLFVKVGGLAAHALSMLWNMYCDAMGAENMVTLDICTPVAPNGVTVTIQRHDGKTPAEVITELKEENSRLKDEQWELLNELGWVDED